MSAPKAAQEWVDTQALLRGRRWHVKGVERVVYRVQRMLSMHHQIDSAVLLASEVASGALIVLKVTVPEREGGRGRWVEGRDGRCAAPHSSLVSIDKLMRIRGSDSLSSQQHRAPYASYARQAWSTQRA